MRGQVRLVDFPEGMGVREEVGGERSGPGQCGSMGLAGCLPFKTSESHQGFRQKCPKVGFDQLTIYSFYKLFTVDYYG